MLILLSELVCRAHAALRAARTISSAMKFTDLGVGSFARLDCSLGCQHELVVCAAAPTYRETIIGIVSTEQHGSVPAHVLMTIAVRWLLLSRIGKSQH